MATQSALAIVLARSLDLPDAGKPRLEPEVDIPAKPAVSQAAGGDPPDDRKPDPNAKLPADKGPPARLPQVIVWPLVPVPYGTPLSALPPVMVVQGNNAAAPQYIPPLDGTVLPAGQLNLLVRVPGNDDYLDGQLAVQLTVNPATLTVGVKQPASMMAGSAAPHLEFTAQGLIPPDAIDVTFNHAASPATPAGTVVPVTPVLVGFTTGSPNNYAIALQPGQIVVTESSAVLDARLSTLRRAILAQKPEIIDELDAVQDKRNNADRDAQGYVDEIARVQQELDYVGPTGVALAGPGGPLQILADETLQFTATSIPPNATVAPNNPAPVGFTWTSSDTNVLTVSDAGLATRAGRQGGTAFVTARTNSRDAKSAFLAVAVQPRVDAVTITPRASVNFGVPTVLTATLLPLDAPQSVRWQVEPRLKNVTLQRIANEPLKAVLTVAKPTAAGGSPAGTLTITATAESDRAISGSIRVGYGGYAVTRIEIRITSGAIANIGDEVTLSAAITPDEADQALTWSVDDPSIATLSDITDSTVKVKAKGGGRFTVIATAAGAGSDGRDVTGDRGFRATVAVTGFTITPPASVDISQTPAIPVAFLPPNAVARVQWASDAENVLMVVGGRIIPQAAGTANITASIPGTALTQTAAVTVTVAMGAAVTMAQWGVLSPMFDRFAGLIGLKTNDATKNALANYIYNLRQRVTAGAVVTLTTVRAELVQLRNTALVLTHGDWLLACGFATGGGAWIRNSTQVNVQGQNFPIHLTMFEIGESRSVGTGAATLLTWICQDGAGMGSMHATLTARPGGGYECKAFTSGAAWTAPATYRAAFPVNAAMLDTATGNWLAARVVDVTAALNAYLAGIKAHDTDALA